MKKNILVTGGAGYIGSHIVQALCNEGHSVTVFDNFKLGLHENIDPRVERIIEGDILNISDLEDAFDNQVDVVFHFAAWKGAGESMFKPEKYSINNITGTLNLLNMMVKKSTKYFVFSSSAAVYGNPQYLPIDEKHPLEPTNYYGYTKLCIEQNLKWYSELKGIKFSALRYFNATGYDINGIIKGKEQNPANLSPIVMEVLSGVRDLVEVYGNDYDTSDGTCVRDYIHVTDLAIAHLLSMKYIIEKDKNIIVNLGSGEGHTVMDIINSAAKISNKNVNFKISSRREGDPAKLVASSKLAKQLINWEPKYSDLDTIFKTMLKVYA